MKQSSQEGASVEVKPAPGYRKRNAWCAIGFSLLAIVTLTLGFTENVQTSSIIGMLSAFLAYSTLMAAVNTVRWLDQFFSSRNKGGRLGVRADGDAKS